MAHGGSSISTQIKGPGGNQQSIRSGAAVGGGGGASNALHQLRSEVEVCAWVGDINTMSVDVVIICSIAGSLVCRPPGKKHPSLAHQVIRAQPMLKDFLMEFKKTRDGLAAGEVIVYKARVRGGRSVIFAAGPKISDYHVPDECYETLRCTFTNCFEAAVGINATTVAVPAISSGGGGIHVPLVVQILVDAVADFLHNYEKNPSRKVPNTLKKIIFVTEQRDVALEFEKKWKERKSSGIYNPNAPAAKASSSARNGSVSSSGGQLARPSIHDNNSLRKNPSKFASSQADAACSRGAYQTRAGIEAARKQTERKMEIDDDDDDDDNDDDNDDNDNDLSQDCQIISRPNAEKDKNPEEKCPICLEDVQADTKKEIPGCKHVLCQDCFMECTQRQPVCPICRKAFGVVIGDQPKDATMTYTMIPQSLPGYTRCGTIVINYTVRDGIQTVSVHVKFDIQDRIGQKQRIVAK